MHETSTLSFESWRFELHITTQTVVFVLLGSRGRFLARSRYCEHDVDEVRRRWREDWAASRIAWTVLVSFHFLPRANNLRLPRVKHDEGPRRKGRTEVEDDKVVETYLGSFAFSASAPS